VFLNEITNGEIQMTKLTVTHFGRGDWTISDSEGNIVGGISRKRWSGYGSLHIHSKTNTTYETFKTVEQAKTFARNFDINK
tara:strand:+ start:490 stop:732 length:243 start_codon:yes stop_codon:yes gene_type:complete